MRLQSTNEDLNRLQDFLSSSEVSGQRFKVMNVKLHKGKNKLIHQMKRSIQAWFVVDVYSPTLIVYRVKESDLVERDYLTLESNEDTTISIMYL